ncbi:shikimate dehydrogenase [Thioclava sp. SK-1]|uniref:shikimate dehydrogenase n=1 Tax=Thioclava sp. SK-1 TaxID=1889770 RepID=UPI0008246743|nr:shikimate dehydrogenase [Thioclava sp. SK-1]OCX67356.1 shikimate dehydrogenase [Thioclava sp. SK-1]
MTRPTPDDATLLAGLIGKGISQSRTPAMHMAEAKAQGMTGLYVKLDMDDPKRADLTLEQMVLAAEAAGFDGLNITYPYKIDIIPLLDELAETAKFVGAVNTVVFKDGKRVGHNTDLTGFAENYRRGLSDAPKEHVLLVGAGGAGVAVAHALGQCNVTRLTIMDVDPARAQALADQVAGNCPDMVVGAVSSVDQLDGENRPDGLVNATPMGMAKLPGMCVPAAFLGPDMWVADIVYFPLETELLRTARALGCRVLPGSGMTVFQAVRAFELFTGRSADPERMKARFDAFDT